VRLEIAVLAIGDELISGEISDTNTARIANLLRGRGFVVREARCVGDDEARIATALRELARSHQVVLVTGGLGPTRDDLTARAAGQAFERPLILHEEALGLIRDFFHETGLEWDPRNEKQALLPQKALAIPNITGTAPGFWMRHEGCDLVFMPGVPEEMAAMCEREVLPHLEELCGGLAPLQERVLKIFGLSEPRVEGLLDGADLPGEIGTAFGVDYPFVHLKLRLAGERDSALLDRAEGEVRERLGDYIVARDDETLAGNVGRLLTEAGLKLSVAESCTGGLLAEWLTDIPGASNFFDRGAVTYSNEAKNEWLGVSKRILLDQGAVSEDCARAMAMGMRQAARTDLAVAITGIAGPAGGTAEKPVGTVFIALSAGDAEQAKGYRFGGERYKVRRMAACMALEWIRRYLAARGGTRPGR